MSVRKRRQQLMLTPRQVAALEQLAVRLERTKSELMREAIDRFIADPPRAATLPRGYKAS
jgi:predicted DNA-binding protein